MRDGEIVAKEPDGIVGYVAVPFWRWVENLPFA
jgi:hypothetical protein